MRQALAESAAAQKLREERLGQAATPIYVGSLPTRQAFAVKVVALYNRDGATYTDFGTDRFVAFLKCHSWSIKKKVEGEDDLWIACRKQGRFGLQSTTDDASFGVEAGQVIAALPSGLPIQVPGQESGTYFDGVFEPMESSQLAGINEVGTFSFWAALTGAVEGQLGDYYFERVPLLGFTGVASEINGNPVIFACVIPDAGTVVRIFCKETDTGISYTFEYDGAGFWAILGTYSFGSYSFTAPLGFYDFAGEAVEVNGKTTVPAGTIVRIFTDSHFSGMSGFRFEYTPPGDANLTEGPGIDLSGSGPVKISASIDADYALEFSPGEEPAQMIRVRKAVDGGLEFVTDGIAPGCALGVKVDNDQGLAIGDMFDPPANTIYIKILKNGNDFIGGLKFADGGMLEAFINLTKGLGVDAEGILVKLEDEETSCLGFNENGEATHVLGDPAMGSGVPTAISGDNLGYVEESSCDVFDACGHFHPDQDNTLKHTGPGAPVYIGPVASDGSAPTWDANGHCAGWYTSAGYDWDSPWGWPNPYLWQ